MVTGVTDGYTRILELVGVGYRAELKGRHLILNVGYSHPVLVKAPEDRLQAVYSEYGIGGYTRNFKLGDTIDQSKISASLKDGVLSLVLPKADRLKPRKIDIATA